MKKILLLALSLFTVPAVFSQRHATGDKTSSAEFAKILRAADRATRDLLNLPPSFSLKEFTPIPQNQGEYGTCVAWSSAYAARTISYAIQKQLTNADSIKKYAFSPGYLYYKIKESGDVNCSSGASILTAMKVMTSNGAILKKEGLVDCAAGIPETTELEKATPYKIKDFLSLNKTYDSITKNDIIKIKKSLTEKKPVVLSLKIYDSFEKVPSTGFWSPTPDDLPMGGHAMCIIGYDDKIAGGSFEIMNSWGTTWGNKGFLWLTYKQAMQYGNYAVELMDFEIGREEIFGDIIFFNPDSLNSDIPLAVSREKINTDNVAVQGNQKADYSLYRLVRTLKSNDSFKMKFSTNSKSYIYVFAEDDKAIISPLFPPGPTISAAINSTNATYYFPSDSTHARLNGPGKENFCILYSKSSIDFEDLLNYIRGNKTSIFQAVKNKLGARLLDLRRVKFRDDRISFRAPAEEKSVLCFFVEMNHN